MAPILHGSNLNGMLVAGVLVLGAVMASWAVPPMARHGYGYGDWDGGIEWASRYVREGVDLAPGRTAIRGDFLARWQRLGAAVEWGSAIGRNIGESRIGGFYEIDMMDFAMGDVRLSAGGRRVHVRGDAPGSSWEVSGRLMWGLAGGLLIDADSYWDVSRRRGGFLTLTVMRPHAIGIAHSDRLTIVPSVQLGLDYGVVSGRRRLRDNHAAFELAGHLAVSPQARLVVALAHSIPLDTVDALPSGRELTWGRLGLQAWF